MDDFPVIKNREFKTDNKEIRFPAGSSSGDQQAAERLEIDQFERCVPSEVGPEPDAPKM